MKNKELELKLIVGTKIKLGKKYCKYHTVFEPGTVIELVEGKFILDDDFGGTIQTAPSVWNGLEKDFDSIYHLFGNDLDEFEDCEIVEE